jgi:hypothetical protein
VPPLREFTFGRGRQLESVLRAHLAGLCQRVDLLPGADERVFIDSLAGDDPPSGPRSCARGDRRTRVGPMRYPGAVRDPDTGEWISDAEVAEIP